SPEFRVVQLTPPGSACSIQFGVGLPDAAGATLQLAVPDLAVACEQLRGRGVDVGEIRPKAPRDPRTRGFGPGLDPDRAPYASFADFADPDGNRWILQELP